MDAIVQFWNNLTALPFMPYVLFVAGLVLLIFGGDWFVDGASGIAKKFHIPELLIGATVVSIGTTLPEVMVSSSAALKSLSEGGGAATAYGNAIGSVICNTALVSAISIVAKPTGVERKTFVKPVIFYFAAAMFYAIISYTTGYFARWCGIVLLIGFVAYMVLLVMEAKQAMKSKPLTEANVDLEHSELNKTEEKEEEEEKEHSLIHDIVFLILGAAAIALGANLLVDNGIVISKQLGVPESVIALIFVALGTSLPELVTAITALAKGHSDLSLGNIVGANLFNLVLVSGLAMTLAPFHIPVEKTLFGMNAALLVDVPMMILVMAILTVPTLIKKKLQRWQGVALLVLYVGYVVFQLAV